MSGAWHHKGVDCMKKNRVRIKEQGDKIIITINPLEAQKSVRNFDPANAGMKVHKSKKGKGSYSRKEKYKNRGCEKNTSLCFLFKGYC